MSAKTSGTAGRCPICRKPTQHDYRPFCSKRCADIDLKRWLSEDYVLPGTEAAESEDEGDTEVLRH